MSGLRCLLLVISAAAFLGTNAFGAHRDGSGPYEIDRVIVEFRDPVRMGDVDSLLGGNGFVGEQCLKDSTTFLVRLPNGWTVEEAVVTIAHREAVAYVGPNYYCHLPELSQMSQAVLDGDADPFTSDISPDDYFTQYAVSAMVVPLGHLMATGTGQIIALIDNGVDFTHPVLESALSGDGYDFVDADEDPSYEAGDCAGHGTFSAGLLVLTAPEATILPIRALSSDGFGTIFTITLGIDYAVDAGVEVLCLEFSIPVDDRVLRAAIGRAEAAGVLAIAPAGNDNAADPCYPAAYSSVMGVAATDSLDLKAGFSNYGPSVDLCAPGVDVYSALPGGDVWGRWSGTSFSTPLVAGLAGIVRQLHPSAPAAACRRILQLGADPIDSLNPSYVGALGDGRVDFARSTGQVAPVTALWGWVTDAVGVGQGGVAVHILQDETLLPESASATDSVGFYASALIAGVRDLVFVPPSSSGYSTNARVEIQLGADTSISTVLTAIGRGDLNADGVHNLIDVTAMIDYVFRGAVPPDAEFLADVTCDSKADVADVVRLIEYVFRAGVQPSCP